MSEVQDGSSKAKASALQSNNPSSLKLGPVERSMLEYVMFVHGPAATRRASLIALLIHAELLARCARPSESNKTSVLSSDCLKSDPIRLSYTLIPRPNSGALSTASSQLQVSVAETDSHIFVSLTDTDTDKFGHLELSGIEHVRIDSTERCSSGDISYVFPQLDSLLEFIEENLWKPVLPSPPLSRPLETDRTKDKSDSRNYPDESPSLRTIHPPSNARPVPGAPFPDYGRSDLDPFSNISGIPGRGGMLLDPRNLVPSSGSGVNPFMGGPDVLPPGAVPPGARFDPFGPGVMPARSRFGSNRPRAPDPDHALPPGFEDMYL